MNFTHRTRTAVTAGLLATVFTVAACAAPTPTGPTTTTTVDTSTTTTLAPAHVNIYVVGAGFGQVTVSSTGGQTLVCGQGSTGCSGDVPAGEAITYSERAAYNGRICDPLTVTVDGISTDSNPLTLGAGSSVEMTVAFQPFSSPCI